jgi:Na+-translocating membrane potential-generating system (MpsC)
MGGGRGATRAKAYWAGDDTLLVLFTDCFTRAEQTLWAAGAGDAAELYRSTVQDVLDTDMRAEAERCVGRPVIAAMACTHHDPDLIAQIFVFEPA